MKSKTIVALCILTIGMIIMNCVLLKQNLNLKAQLDERQRSMVLKPGTMLNELEGNDVDGNQYVLSYGSNRPKTVLLVFSPLCGYCTQNLKNWRALYEGLDRKAFRVVAVSTISDGVKEYMSSHEFNIAPVISDVAPKKKVEYEMTVTPQTILIDSDGRVESVWAGVLDQQDKRQIEAAVGVHLPS